MPSQWTEMSAYYGEVYIHMTQNSEKNMETGL